MELLSPCKINLVLNILGRRPDQFHELETLMIPVPYHDHLVFREHPSGFQLTCSDHSLPVDSTNLVHRAATTFFQAAQIQSPKVSIHLEKRIPMAAGLGGGSGDAAWTLRGLNDFYQQPLDPQRLIQLASSLGSDIPFFLQDRPGLGTGRGEHIESLKPFTCLQGLGLFLFHPGFGISTPWSYGQLVRFPKALNGTPGRAAECARALGSGDLTRGLGQLYNSLEAPALEKYPILALYQEFLKANGALGVLMSGSGSATFALFDSLASAQAILPKFQARFGQGWAAAVEL